MKEQLEALYSLQELDLRIAQIKNKLASMGGGKEAEAKINAAKAAIEAAENELAQLEAELKDNELKLKSIDEKRASFEKKLYEGGVTNPKELSAIEKEISMLKKQQSQQDEITLKLYDKVNAAREKVESLKNSTLDLQNRISDALKKQSDLKDKLEAELEELLPKREEAAKKVTDKSLLARYDSIRRKTGTAGVAKVIDGKCEHCHISLTTFTMRNLVSSKEYQYCESCGRILFLVRE